MPYNVPAQLLIKAVEQEGFYFTLEQDGWQ